MSKHLARDLAMLDRELLALSSVVDEMIAQASRALTDRDGDAASQLVASDREVDRREVMIEEACLKVLALHQPVAIDLRRVATVLKINNDLERIADLAVNVAERALHLSDDPAAPMPVKLERMAAEARSMVARALDAFVNLDVELAKSVCHNDDTLDVMNADVISELRARMAAHPEEVDTCLNFFSASRHFERIADHATNIAEDVIYLVEGDIVRHRHEQIALSESKLPGVKPGS